MKKEWKDTIDKYSSKKGDFYIEKVDIPVFDEMISFCVKNFCYISKKDFFDAFIMNGQDYMNDKIINDEELEYIRASIENIKQYFLS